MPKRKLAKIVLAIGILCLIAAPILGYFLDKLQLFNVAPVTISENSDNDLQDAFAYPISIEKNKKLVVEFSVFYPNVSATIKIFGKGTYDSEIHLHRSPSIPTGQNFVYSQFVYGSFFAGSTDTLTITNNGYWYIEFAGGASGANLISYPGNYVVVVYGFNSGPSSDTTISFNLMIKIDGPGDLLEEIFYYIGAGIIVCLVLFISYGYFKKLRRGI
ncbi:MAG: hypothetical protein ACFFCI_11915 [Promethearchaeota archaeon]